MNIDYQELSKELNYQVKDAPIIVIDSGRGGLGIIKQLKEQHPTENFILFADTQFLPYGNKNPQILSRRVIKNIAKLKKLQPKVMILGCNTIDAVLGDKIEAQVGLIPLIRIIEPTAKQAIKQSKTKQIGLFATTNTILSQNYIYAMSNYYPNTNLYGVECLNLALAIEHYQEIKQTCLAEIEALKDYDIDTIILGCTHYHVVKPIIIKQFPQAKIIDSSQVVIQKTNQALEKKLIKNVASAGSLRIITTSHDDGFTKSLENYLVEQEYHVINDF